MTDKLREAIEETCDHYGLLEVFDLRTMKSEYHKDREEILDQLASAVRATLPTGTTLDEIARLVHESEQLKRDLAQAERRGNTYERQYRRVREERNEARQKLRDMGVAESEILRRTTPDA